MTRDTSVLPAVHARPSQRRRRTFGIRSWADAADCARFVFYAELALGLAIIFGLALAKGWLG